MGLSFDNLRNLRPRTLLIAGLAVLPWSLATAMAADKPAQGLAPHARTPAVDVSAMLAKHGLNGARVGFHVIDQENGGLISTRAADAMFIPASTAKIVTAAGALGVLGPAYRFRTSVHATGGLRDGVLNGDLYLKGTGDPLLSVQDLLGMIERLKDLGIGRIAGRFYFDESSLPRLSVIDPDQPSAAPYNSGLSALSLDFNRIRVHWRRAADGTFTANLSPAPGAGTLSVAAADDTQRQPFATVMANGTTALDTWTVAPDLLPTAKGIGELPVHDAGRRTAMVFRAMAAATGTTMPLPSPAPTPKQARELTAIDSPPLTRILRPALEYSNNMVSELIGLAAVRKLAGKPANLAASSKRLVQWLAGRTLDLDLKGLLLPNHSGLSAAARVTPKQMLAFLRHALLMRYGADGIVPLLPAGGWRDSLGGRFRDPAVASWVWAKSGTLHYATGLVGVLFGQTSGRRAVFALYVMDDRRRAAYDADPARETVSVQDTAKAWIDKAKAFEEELVSAWVNRY